MHGNKSEGMRVRGKSGSEGAGAREHVRKRCKNAGTCPGLGFSVSTSLPTTSVHLRNISPNLRV
jgi:hypothetical protein